VLSTGEPVLAHEARDALAIHVGGARGARDVPAVSIDEIDHVLALEEIDHLVLRVLERTRRSARRRAAAASVGFAARSASGARRARSLAVAERSARSITFASSRTLPGQP
jgi:hypothetical protein